MTKPKLSHTSPCRLAVLLLAAGEGSRLGSYPKALLKKRGLTLLQRFMESIEGFSPVELIVVTGFHAEVIESTLDELAVLMPPKMSSVMKVCRNLEPARGQAASVRLGLESLQSEYDVLLVALSDQPEIEAAEIQDLLDAFSVRSTDQEMLLPMVGTRRGNPVLFSRKAINAILAIPGMTCRPYMDAHPAQVGQMQTHKQAFILDVDTPEDIQMHQLTRS